MQLIMKRILLQITNSEMECMNYGLNFNELNPHMSCSLSCLCLIQMGQLNPKQEDGSIKQTKLENQIKQV